MLKIIAIVLFAIVRAEEESPVTITKNADKIPITSIHEDLQRDNDFRKLNIKILSEDALSENDDISKSETAKDTNHKRSTDTISGSNNLKTADNAKENEPLASKKDDDIEFLGRSGSTTSRDDSNRKGNSELAIELERNDTEESIIERKSSPHEEVDAMSDTFKDADFGSSENTRRSTGDNIILDTKGRAGEYFGSWEEVKVPSGLSKTFEVSKLLDNNNFLRRKMNNDVHIPNYYDTLARSGYPYMPKFYGFHASASPLFNREPILKSVEKGFLVNTRRTTDMPTDSRSMPKVLEDYTDHDSNNYPYVPLETIPMPPERNAGLSAVPSKLLDASIQQVRSQFNPYSNDIGMRPIYAGNYPYGFNPRFY